MRKSCLQHLHPLTDQAPVRLELGLAGSAQTDASLLPLEVSPSTHETRRQVLELRKLHLQLAFCAVRSLGEDVEDQAGSIDDAAIQRALQIALLRAGQRVVEDNKVGICLRA